MDPVPTTNNKIKILPPGEPVVVRGIVSSVVVFFFHSKGGKPNNTATSRCEGGHSSR
jgi:hypothetical protein